MAKLIEITPVKTYKTPENAVKAVEKKIAPTHCANIRYFIHTHTDGRFFPVFIGEAALQAGIHFHFNIIG